MGPGKHGKQSCISKKLVLGDTCYHPAPPNTSQVKPVKVLTSKWAVPGKPDTGNSFLSVLRSFPTLLQMKERTGLFPVTLKKSHKK